MVLSLHGISGDALVLPYSPAVHKSLLAVKGDCNARINPKCRPAILSSGALIIHDRVGERIGRGGQVDTLQT